MIFYFKTSSRDVIYIFIKMNSNTIPNQSHHELMIQSQANRLKALAPTTSQDPIKQNGPFVHDGCFWNVSQNFNIKQNGQEDRFQQLNLQFQGEIYRKHLNVIKLCLKKYYEVFDLGENCEETYYGTASEPVENIFTRPRSWNKASENFVKSLSEYQFTKDEIKDLASKLYFNPLLLNIFEIFGEPVPARFREKFYLYMFHGLNLTEQLKQFNPLDKQKNLLVVSRKIQELSDLVRIYQDEQKFKQFLEIILYTSAMAGLGRAQNMFFESLSKEMGNQHNFHLTKFQRQLEQISKGKGKKAQLVRRNTLGKTMIEGELPRKRVSSNDP